MEWKEKWKSRFRAIFYLMRLEWPGTLRDDKLNMWNMFPSPTGAHLKSQPNGRQPHPDSKVHGTNMLGVVGHRWPHIGSMNFAIGAALSRDQGEPRRSVKGYTKSLKTIHNWKSPYIPLLSALYLLMTWRRYVESYDSVVASKFCSVCMESVHEMLVNITCYFTCS